MLLRFAALHMGPITKYISDKAHASKDSAMIMTPIMAKMNAKTFLRTCARAARTIETQKT